MKKKIILLVGVLACLSLSACGAETTGNQVKTEGETQNALEKDSQVQKEEDEKNVGTEKEDEEPTESNADTEKQDADTAYNIGDNATLGDWEVSVTDVKFVESITADYGTFSPDSEDSKYVQLFVIVTNNGKQADNFLPSFGFGDDVNAKVLYGEGYEFSATNLLGYSKEMHDSTINPLSSKEGEIAFEVPNSVTDADDELLAVFSSGNDSITFKIR